MVVIKQRERQKGVKAERGKKRRMEVWVPKSPSRPSSNFFKQVPPHKVSPSPKSHRLRSKPQIFRTV